MMLTRMLNRIASRFKKEEKKLSDDYIKKDDVLGDLYAHPVTLAYHLGLMSDDDIDDSDSTDVYGEALLRLYRRGYPVHVEKISIMTDLIGRRFGYGDFVRLDLVLRNIVFDNLLRR